ncbi:MAG: CsiV family protein [Halioglobus sp.]
MRHLLCLALLLPVTAQAQVDRWYRVELLVFSYPAGGAAEQWDATPDLAYPRVTRFLTYPGEPGDEVRPRPSRLAPSPAGTTQPTPFAVLPASQQELAGKAAYMQRSGRYRLLFHEAWIQPITGQSAALPIVLDRSGDGGAWPELQGTIKLYLAGYLYLDTNLWLNTRGEYLHSSWQMPAPPRGPASVVTGEPIASDLQPLAAPATSEPLSQAAPARTAEPAATTAPEAAAYPYRHAVLLKQTRRMRGGELVYIDHPLLGLVIKISPVADTAPDSPTNAAPAAPATPGPTG